MQPAGQLFGGSRKHLPSGNRLRGWTGESLIRAPSSASVVRRYQRLVVGRSWNCKESGFDRCIVNHSSGQLFGCLKLRACLEICSLACLVSSWSSPTRLRLSQCDLSSWQYLNKWFGERTEFWDLGNLGKPWETLGNLGKPWETLETLGSLRKPWETQQTKNIQKLFSKPVRYTSGKGSSAAGLTVGSSGHGTSKGTDSRYGCRQFNMAMKKNMAKACKSHHYIYVYIYYTFQIISIYFNTIWLFAHVLHTMSLGDFIIVYNVFKSQCVKFYHISSDIYI